MSRRTVAVLFLTVVCAAAAVTLAPSKGMAARTQIEILKATVDLGTNRITITGDIATDVQPAVSLAGVNLVVESYNPQTGTVVALLPGALEAGTYRLRVSEGHVTDSMGVTITP